MWNKIKDSKGVYIAISIFCAILIWMYIDVTEKPDAPVTIRNIPVTFYGEDLLEEDGLMIADAEGRTVNLTLTGNRSTLSNLNRDNIIVRVDASSQISKPGEVSLDYTVTLPSGTSSVKIKSRSVETIDVTVIKMGRKTIGLRGVFTGSVADGYMYDTSRFSFSVEQITIHGEQSLVESVDHAQVTLSEKNLTDTWQGSLPVSLVDGEGNPVDSEDLILSDTVVDVTFPVYAVKTVPLSVEILPGGGATEDDITCQISPKKITVSGTKNALEELDEITLGEIDLAQIITSETENIAIDLPEGITNVSGTTSAQVSVSVNSDLVTKKLNVTNLTLKNVPEGREATLLTESLEVRIRGDKDSMSLLMERDVSVEVDLSKLEEESTGVCAVAADVKVTGLSDVGVIGTYEVTVQID